MKLGLLLVLAVPGLAAEWGPYRGANVNHQFSDEDARVLAGWGGNLVRINFHQLPLMDKQPPYAINMAAVEALDRILDTCEKHGIRAIIDPHTTPGTAINFTTSPNDALWRDFAFHEHLIRLWDFLARRYHDRGPVIAGYDLLNEPAPPTGPGTAGTPADWNLLARRIAAAIRAVDREHTLIVEFPLIANAPGGLPPVQQMVDYLELLDDPNTVYSIHWYGPGEFTHQGVDGRPAGLQYPGFYRGVQWDAALHRSLLQPVVEFQRRHKVPIYLGEFAAARWAGAGGNRWMDDVAEAAEREGWSWTYHAFRIGSVWDAEKSNTDPSDETRYESTPRVEWLKSILARNRGPAPRQARDLPAGGAAVFRTAGDPARTAAGWAVARTPSDPAGPFGQAIIRLRQHGVTVFEAVVPGTAPSSRLRVLIEDRRDGPEPVQTTLAIVNPGDRPARIWSTWRDAGGAIAATGELFLEAGSHRAGFWHELAQVSPDPAIPVTGSLDLESDEPIAAAALRLTVNRRGDLLFSPLPVIGLLEPPSAGPSLLACFAGGGGFSSWWTLVNATAQPQSGMLQFHAEDGQPLPAQPLQGPRASAFRYEIPPHGVFSLPLDGSSPTRMTGWVQIKPDPGHTAPAGAGILRFSAAATAVTEAAVPESPLSSRLRFFAGAGESSDVSLALVNPSSVEAAVELLAFLDDGTPAARSVTLSLEAGAQRRARLRALLPDLPSGYQGVVELRSSPAIAALGLRSLINERGETLLSTLPAADLNRPAPAPLIIPHLATGGGFDTQLVLFGGQEGGAANITLFSSGGRLLPLLQP